MKNSIYAEEYERKLTTPEKAVESSSKNHDSCINANRGVMSKRMLCV